jgi:hypothetical protein
MNRIRLFIISSVLFIAASVHGQNYYGSCPGPDRFFTGRSDFQPDGLMSDWNALLRDFTGDVIRPFIPSSDLNYALDGECGSSLIDFDAPQPQHDIVFSATTHDDHNLYFYLRRRAAGNAVNTLYYFFDTNADGFMNRGEPVAIIAYNAHTVVNFSMGYYQPNYSIHFIEGKGNPLNSPITGQVNGYSMPGTVTSIFSVHPNRRGYQLASNESFGAAVTENGFGIEFALPWKFLKNYFSSSASMKPNDLLPFRISMAEGILQYAANRVKDNAGGCCHKNGLIGAPNFSISKATIKTLVANKSYKLSLQLQNNANVPEFVDLQTLTIGSVTATGAYDLSEFSVNAFLDLNSNGVKNDNEPLVNFEIEDDPFLGKYFKASGPLYAPLAPGEIANFVLQVNLPQQSNITGFTSFAGIGVDLNILDEYQRTVLTRNCSRSQCIGRPINPVGFTADTEEMRKQVKEEMSEFNIQIFPNPSTKNGTIQVSGIRPNSEVSIWDVTGKLIRQYKGNSRSILQVEGLSAGNYIFGITDAQQKVILKKKVIILP